MKKMIVICDRCKNEIKTLPHTMNISITHSEGMKEISTDFDVCDECVKDMIKQIPNMFDLERNFSDATDDEDDQILEELSVDGPEESDEDPDLNAEKIIKEQQKDSTIKITPEELKAPKEKKEPKRKPLDKEKILTLRAAGWPYQKIADEMNCSVKTVSNTLYLMRKEGRDIPKNEKRDWEWT